MNRKVLIISYLFPPIGGGGVLRVTKFVKYLPKFNWKLYVLTVKEGFYPTLDPSLIKEISAEVEITRIGYFEPAFWLKYKYWQSFLAYLIYPLFLIPDRQILWFWPALISALKILKKEKIKIIFTSSAPATDHLIGLVLKKITGLKWVADFRDEWANNPLKKYPTPIHRYLNQFLEKKVIKNADQIITVSEPITEYLKNLSIDKKKFSTITNGFDEEDFEGLRSHKNKIFHLVHVGGLYSLKYQKDFEDAFESLNLKNASLNFIGTKRRLPHKKAIKEMMKADILLLILDPVERPAVMTGKLFEYLRGRKPILALVPRSSAAAKMITKYQIGVVIEPNPEAFKKEVLKMYQKWLASRSGQKNDLAIPSVNLERFERKNLTENLIKIFEGLTKKQKKIKLCLIGNIQSSQNQNLCHYFIEKGYDIHFITTQPGNIAGVKTYFLGNNSFTPWYFTKSLYKIRKIIQIIKPDIVHGQDLVFAGIWAYLSGFQPFVVTPWGSDVLNYERFVGFEKYLVKKTLQKADLVTVSSVALQKQAEMIGLEKNKAQMVHFGIDLDVFKYKSKNNLGLIFCPRTIGPIYNTDILIHAFAQVIQKNKNARLALISNWSDKNYLLEVEKLIIHYGLVNKVLFWPRVDNQGMVDYYNKAEVIVSLSSSDGCSVSFLEAMACEKKIVATDLPYIKEWVNGKNLWLVPVRDVGSTSKAILAALKYPNSKWQKIGKLNREMIAKKAEIKSNFKKLARLYQSLI